MKTAPYVFMGKNLVVRCYVDGLILFEANEDSIEILYHDLKIDFRVENLWQPTQLVGLDINWTNGRSLKLSQELFI